MITMNSVRAAVSAPGRRASVRAVAAVVVAALALGLGACGSTRDGSAQDGSVQGGSVQGAAGAPAAPGRDVGTSLDQPLPTWLQQLPLTNGQGKTVRLADFADRVIVLSDTMTLCQETCPIDTATVVQTAGRVASAGRSAKVEFLSVTVDPTRDTPTQIAAYQKLFQGAPANWQVLTGSAADVDRLWSYFGVYREKAPADAGATNWRTGAKLSYDVTHSDEVFFLSGGQERFLLEGTPDLGDKSKIPPRLYRYLSDQGRTNLAHPDDGAWTVPQAVQTIGWLAGTPVG